MKTVAIVGRAKTWVHAPFDNPNVDIWGMNDHPMRANLPRLDLLFELHDDCMTTDRYEADYKAWLMQRHPFPVMMKTPDPRIPWTVQLPRLHDGGLWKGADEIPFYTSTTPYMIAVATMRGYKRIELYGIELATENERYREHRPSVMYWIGRAAGAGCDVVIHETSKLYSASVYP